MPKLLLAVLLVLVGCGLPAVPGSTAAETEGSWTGTFSFVGTDGSIQGGSLALTVASGKVQGSGRNNQLKSNFTAFGELDALGNADIGYTYPNNGTYKCNGKVDVLNHHISGTLRTTLAGSFVGNSGIDLVRN